MLTRKCLLCWIACLLLGFLPHATAQKDEVVLQYVVSKTDPTTSLLFDALKAGFPDKPVGLINLGEDSFVEQGNAVYLAAGSRVLDHLLSKEVKAPIIAVFMSSLAYAQVLEAHTKTDYRPNISAVYSDSSIPQQLALIQSIFGEQANVAVLLSQKTEFLKKELLAAANKIDVNIKIHKHLPGRDINKSHNQTRGANVLLALPDSTIYNRTNLKKIILSSYRKRQAIIGYSVQLVEAGGIATVYSDPEDLAEQTILLLQQYFANGALPPPQHADSFDIKTNEYLARSINLVLPDKVKLKEQVASILGACCVR